MSDRRYRYKVIWIGAGHTSYIGDEHTRAQETGRQLVCTKFFRREVLASNFLQHKLGGEGRIVELALDGLPPEDSWTEAPLARQTEEGTCA